MATLQLIVIMNVYFALDLNRMGFFLDIISYGMLSAVDGRAKNMYLVYGDEIGRRAGPPEYMSPTSITRIVHRDSAQNIVIEEILKNMLVEEKPRGRTAPVGRYTCFSNFLEG